ncbi:MULTISPECIES: undecaprenyl-diphosphate phosphatase [unclassified Treponema]|uniref:undecaprenyl-diphosphate phosphatase n=1 Tax=unclassified Treponema TaxID=2638727 RepID=UPI0020A31EDA|nr:MULTISPECIES: undecaprenyl-diphosphate phosphatase [unclassified Treponema]UTC66784.1 undecaprenyl-diphosphate phosphatase [Treponema sp. OMZ 789]UTC69517.1 undecaprenyl-diphosphate phosphatase [Treponema sp. OMZ 790]UTC72231.1 undecaprenyl-diphosphate phosphatase [Treponema sp. OMZ 791]
MSIFQAIILGAVQGFAEFLPVSSSGHLAVVEYFFKQEDLPILFDILLHVATLAAVCTVFAKKIAGLFCVLGRFIIRKSKPEDKEDLNIIAAIIIATAITGVIGLLLRDWVKVIDIRFIPIFFIVTGLLLIASSKIKCGKSSKKIGLITAIVTGFAQGIGVIPGISRSGSTISASLFAGLDREKAGEFSFLLSIPAILAAFILEVKSADNLFAGISPIALIAGMISAFIVGYFSLRFLLTLIKKGKLMYFAFYLIPLGIGLSVYFWGFAG